MWATTKYITQLLLQGKVLEFCEERVVRWKVGLHPVSGKWDLFCVWVFHVHRDRTHDLIH